MTDGHRFLFATWDGGGAVPPLLSVAGALTARGHEVRVLGDPVLADEVAATGAQFRPWTMAPHRTSREDPGTEVVRDWEAKTPLGAFARLRDRLIFGPAGLFASDTLAELAKQPADAVVTDHLLAGVGVAAEARTVPLALCVPNVLPLPRRGVPPFGMGLKPARGPLGRARDGALGFANQRLWGRGLPELNAARVELGLNRLVSVYDQFYRADRLLVLTSAAFDYPSCAAPANARYVGPRLDDPSWAEPWNSPWPAGDPRPLGARGPQLDLPGPAPDGAPRGRCPGTASDARPHHGWPRGGCRGGRSAGERGGGPVGPPRRRPSARLRGDHTRRARHGDQGPCRGRSDGLPSHGPRPGRHRRAGDPHRRWRPAEAVGLRQVDCSSDTRCSRQRPIPRRCPHDGRGDSRRDPDRSRRRRTRGSGDQPG